VRCLGRTKTLRRCRREPARWFCRDHRFQPVALLISLVSIVAAFAGLYRDALEPWITKPNFIGTARTEPEALPPPESQAFQFVGIGCPDDQDTFPTGINALGDVVGICHIPTGQGGFLRRRDGSVTTFDYPSAVGSTNATGINTSGAVVGFYYDAEPRRGGSRAHGFVRDQNGSFSSFDYPSSTRTFAHAINDAGDVVGVYETGERLARSFLRKADGSFVDVKCPGNVQTIITSISSGGSIVGYCAAAEFVHSGFMRRNEGEFVDISKGGPRSMEPRGVNGLGVVVGRSALGAFLREVDGRTYRFEHPACASSTCTTPTAINDTGEVVGYYQLGSDIYGFIASTRKPDGPN
jgi:hypothetical protein